ncbi:aspartate aminotransferase, mitochondrial-like isoform X2 [Cucurbita maxima]|uniref:Aspartate aminotransferase, mitochondrial-like isoform X2 n=1 Tax=Cucurbita maxima TaxID=3661 RepID=A0A6J1HPH7_CUCMA|nr:aspartate aminotransferase, mitochondrial-like isoform X2 [Cucurbita maxima]
MVVGCAQSFAKNMGLYGHRVRCLSVLGKVQQQAMIVRSQLQRLARAMYSSPLIRVKAEWIEELKVGMVCYSGLNCKQIDLLARDFGVHMNRDGHVSLAGITTRNVYYLRRVSS